MCGCTGSIAQAAPEPQTLMVSMPTYTIENCPYNLELLNVWRENLLCVKTHDLFTEVGVSGIEVNQYLGIVISAINYTVNPCYFKDELDKIQDVIFRIVNTGVCQTS